MTNLSVIEEKVLSACLEIAKESYDGKSFMIDDIEAELPHKEVVDCILSLSAKGYILLSDCDYDYDGEVIM